MFLHEILEALLAGIKRALRRKERSEGKSCLEFAGLNFDGVAEHALGRVQVLFQSIKR